MDPNLITEPLPTSQQTPIQTQTPERHNPPTLLWLLILTLFGLTSYFGYQNWQLNKQIENQRLLSLQRITPAPSPISTPHMIQGKSLSDSIVINGWKHFENDRMSIEIPNNWNIFDLSNQKTYYGDIPPVNFLLTDNATDPRYDNLSASTGSSNTIGVSLGTAYRSQSWSSITSLTTFFDLNSNLWTNTMRKSGGGGLLQTTIQLNQLANNQTVKRINTWTQAMEGVDSTDVDFFFPDKQATDQLLVWNIAYRLPIKGNNITERQKTIDQVLSTLKFTN